MTDDNKAVAAASSPPAASSSSRKRERESEGSGGKEKERSSRGDKEKEKDRGRDRDRDRKDRKEEKKEKEKEKRRSRSRDRGGRDRERERRRRSSRSRSRSPRGGGGRHGGSSRSGHRRERSRSRSAERHSGGSKRAKRESGDGARKEEDKASPAAPAPPPAPVDKRAEALSVIARLSARVSGQSSAPLGPVPTAAAVAAAGLAAAGPTAPAPEGGAEAGDTSEQDALTEAEKRFELEMRQRQERIRAFQEQRRLQELQQQTAAGATLAQAAQMLAARQQQAPGGAGVKPKKWSLEEEEDEEEAGGAEEPLAAAEAGGSTAAAAKDTPGALSVEHQPSVGGAVEEEEDLDLDPLDAFMTSLERDGPVPAQAEMYGAFGGGDESGGGGGRRRRANGFDPLGSNTITAAELFGGKGRKAGWESDTDVEGDEVGGPAEFDEFDETPSPAAMGEEGEEEEMDEEALEREKQAFLAAIRNAPLATEATAAAAAAPGGAVAVKMEEPATAAPPPAAAAAVAAKARPALGRIFEEDGDVEEEGAEQGGGPQKSALELLQEQAKKKELKPVDHAAIEYLPVRKKLYIVPRALHQLSEKEVAARRDALEIKVRGKGCPAPIDDWEQTGLSDRVLQVLQKRGMAEPFAIQRQALPAIMAGRDIIGVAKTGSGKTLAFLLPMLRHILDQEQTYPLGEGEGPIGLIMAPARELAVQIYTEARRFCKPLGLHVVAVYGGAGIADQIGELKRGAHIVVCTPGRMIDILTMQAGRVVSLQRVSFVVMDEADRMFDMGFEPQIRMILGNVRPDRQTVLFSATFPKQVEALARKVLAFPLEIIVGGRSVASDQITQYAEVHEESEKFMRLLQLLGVWYEKGNVLVFVDTQQKCDAVFADLMKAGYPCLSLHGGMDQMDRDSTIHDFKSRARTLMVATSVAGRGLDVPELCCVINYACPNHLEDYVHRVGRTGRAGRKGTAYTFITPDEEQFAPLLLKALEQSKQVVPPEVKAMADAFAAKVEAGQAHWAASGFKGKGFTFDESEQTETQRVAAAQKKQYEIEQGLRAADEGLEAGGGFSSDEEEEEQQQQRPAPSPPTVPAPAAAAAAAIALPPAPAVSLPSPPPAPAGGAAAPPAGAETEAAVPAAAPPAAPAPEPGKELTPLERARLIAARMAQQAGTPPPAPSATAGLPTLVPGATGAAATPALTPAEAMERARALAASVAGGQPKVEVFSDEIEINEYPQQARWKVMHRETVRDLQERTECAIIHKGIFCGPGQQPPPGERKIYILIEGRTEMAVRQARREIQRMLDEETLRVGARGGPQFGRYSVV